MTRDKLSIFIVDDDTDFAESLAEVIEMRGYDVQIANDGEEAVERFRKNSFDLVFMDVKLPGIDGVEAFSRIRAQQSDAKVIMMTGFKVEQRIKEALQNGAWTVLSKPLDIDYVLQVIERLDLGGVLIAEDDADFRATIEEILTEKGYSVILAQNGEEALARAKKNAPDVVILDLRLPLIHGIEVYLEMRRENINIPTIIITAYLEEEATAIKILREHKVDGILVKPFAPEDLLNLIEKAKM